MTTANRENLGAAERIIQTLLTYSDHLVHNRPGIVLPDPTSAVGVKWLFAQARTEGVTGNDDAEKHRVVYEMRKAGKKTTRVRLGILQSDGKTILNGTTRVGEYRRPGFFPEVCAWVYRQIAEIWRLDNEFAARWASYQFAQEHRDIKMALAAFMLVQSRSGAPIAGDDGKFAFNDDDFREVGEAMLLLNKDKHSFNAKLVHRVRDFLWLPEVAKINHELGFGRSARRPTEGRWAKTVQKWLAYREHNPKLLDGLVKAGFRQEVISLACQTRYVPATAGFYQALRWKQQQAKDGRRTIALNADVAAAETWAGLTEEQVCEKIVQTKPGWNRLTSLLPKGVGITRATMMAAIEAGCISNQEMIILAPTIEELGLLKVPDVQARLDKALAAADNQRAANIALRMRSKEGADKLQAAADVVLQKQVAEVTKGVFIYVFIDISGSMHTSIPVAKEYIARFLQGFPPDKLCVCTFNTVGRIVEIKHASKAGVENAFKGIGASGGTYHSVAVSTATRAKQPAADEDAVMIWVGDGGESSCASLVAEVRRSGVNPVAFGFLKLPGDPGDCINQAAAGLGIPCFGIDERIFADPYAIPRTMRQLIAATPVGKSATVAQPVVRQTLVDQILATKLLVKPSWASVVSAQA